MDCFLTRKNPVKHSEIRLLAFHKLFRGASLYEKNNVVNKL